jgi:hypothetical protein
VQSSNDAVAIKKKFGKKLMLCGAFESRPFLPHIDVTEEQVRGAVRELLDKLASGGGYAFFGGGDLTGNPVTKQRSEWVNDEFEKIKGNYYK